MGDRAVLVGLAAAAVVAGGAAVAAAQGGGSRLAELKTMFIDASSARDPAPGAAANLYPGAARRGGVEGTVMLRCAAAPEDRFTDCEVVEEQPAGQGFGASALAASRFVRQPLPAGKKGERVVALLPFAFTLEERRAGLVADAEIEWEKVPSKADMSRVYPERARLTEQQGYAIIGCRLGSDGRLADCHAYDEWPHGFRFTEAALAVAGQFKARTRLKNGQPLPPDSLVRIPVTFRLQ